MKTKTLIFSSILVPFLCLTTSAQIPAYSANEVALGFDNVEQGAAGGVGALIFFDTRRQDVIAFYTSFKCVSAGTNGPVTFTFIPCLETASLPTATTKQLSWVVTSTGTAKVSDITTITNAGYGWLNLVSVTNLSGATVTNITFKYSIKRL